MICKYCGSEIPDDAQSCPNCGELLKSEEEIVPERERIALEKGITKELFVFFSQNVGSAFSKDALLNRLEEIIKNTKTREYSSQHLQKLLYKMVQKGSITSSLHNNENHYHISVTNQEKQYQTKADDSSLSALHSLHSLHSADEKSRKSKSKPRRVKPIGKGATTAFIILPIIGVILTIVGVVILFNIPSKFPVGITLIIIGILTLVISLGILDYKKGGGNDDSWLCCCECLTCIDCAC